MTPDHPERVATRAKFLKEHRHLEDEVRFFADGAGLFCLHIGGEVYAIVCERGDLLAVPAGAAHWFDMGSKPSFVALRFFDSPAGWVPDFTGADIAQRFPGFDQLARRTGVNVVLVDIEGTISQLLVWQDEDVKLGPLKQLQGLIWEEGYRDGALVAPLYPDARDRLCTWHRAGVPLSVYSSGSVHAQGMFLRHNRAGDIRSWFHGLYDTSVGSKHDEASYRCIAEKLGQPTSAVLFLSDSVAELDAAGLAGMRTCHVLRESGEGDVQSGGLPRPCGSSHTRVSSLLDVAL